jgi:hypothetical protein
MNVWNTVKAVILVLAGLTLALLFQDKTKGWALTVYVFALAVVLVVLMLSRLGRALPLAREPRRTPPQPSNAANEVEQYRTIARQLAMSSWSAHDLHFRLRPLVQEIARARLAQEHGVDLEREPERARQLVGTGRVWELIRPDREQPEDREARGWSESELERLVDELEDL